ncbi:MAG TPA: FecR domain-containing protein [Puia sp.]
MSSASRHTTELFNKLLEGKLSPDEVEELIAWLGRTELEPEAVSMILAQLKEPVTREKISPAVNAALNARLPFILQQRQRRPLLLSLQTHWVRYAAAVIILLGVCTYFLMNRSSQPIAAAKPLPPKADLPPGKNGAILTLADGRTVVLDSLGNGVVATQNGSKVSLVNGQLAYKAEGPAMAAATYNTMTTPRGRQFQLVLPDGTKVWLNAASSLRYPTRFSGTERKVEITGEAYFEVARNTNMPFIVKVDESTSVRVLGTGFDINSYTDEATVNTTLLEGSVQVLHKGEKALLQLGQQAQIAKQPSDGQAITGTSGIKILNSVNVEKVMAWKNGVFDFEDASLEEVMRQLERWYDIEVVYEKNIPRLEFIGKMGRDLTLSNVLRGLELSKVHFRMEGTRRLVILP